MRVYKIWTIKQNFDLYFGWKTILPVLRTYIKALSVFDRAFIRISDLQYIFYQIYNPMRLPI